MLDRRLNTEELEGLSTDELIDEYNETYDAYEEALSDIETYRNEREEAWEQTRKYLQYKGKCEAHQDQVRHLQSTIEKLTYTLNEMTKAVKITPWG